jgi:hypothetical protein
VKANYKNRGIAPTAGFIMGMSAKEARAWDMTEAYRMREYDAIATAMIMSILYYLATKEEDPHDLVSLRQDWEGMVRVRAEARAALREMSSGADYTLTATGKNVEDYYMMEELRKMGVNIKQWEDSAQIDPKTGEITFGPWEPPKGGRRA